MRIPDCMKNIFFQFEIHPDSWDKPELIKSLLFGGGFLDLGWFSFTLTWGICKEKNNGDD